MMTQDRFEALCDAYGGDIARWPDDVQADAQAFRDAEPETAQALLTAAQALDEALRAAPVDAPSEALFNTIVDSGVEARRPQQPVWAAVAAALMLSVGLGAGWLVAPEPQSETDALYASAFGSFESVETLTAEEDV